MRKTECMVVRLLLSALALGLWSNCALTHENPQQKAFAISDYFRLRRVSELVLTSDGEELAYIVESPSLPRDSTTREVFVQTVQGVSSSIRVESIDDARALQWIPHTRQLAFLATRSKLPQVYSIDVRTGTLRQWTQATDPVIKFRFSTQGDQLAYSTRSSTPVSKILVDEIKTSKQGILLDTSVFGIYDLLETTARNLDVRHSNVTKYESAKLWIVDSHAILRQITIPGDVREFFWSFNDHQISVTYIENDIPWSMARDQFTSLGIADSNSGELTVLFEGKAPNLARGEGGVGYVGGEWMAPHQRSVLVRRLIKNHPWLREHYPEWAITPVIASPGTKLSWHPMEDYLAKFTVVSQGSILVENRLRGAQSLFIMNEVGYRPSDIVASMTGSNSLFAINDESGTAAFVNESFTRPPEIYLWEKHRKRARKLTDLNPWASTRQMPRARPVTWKSVDGTEVQGWLLEPTGASAGPRPLVTLVHGGPGLQIADQFEPYFRAWPYPLTVFPAYGISVFIPNYRGTYGYGFTFSSPSTQDAEPVDDIITGIDHLITQGVADRNRLGIIGHSHGGWLAPIVLTRNKIFKAASYAEGVTDFVAFYAVDDDMHNRDVVDFVNHANLWDDPETYVRISPDLHFKGVSTALLMESGALSSATLMMLPAAKAARHFGLPAETFLYPDTAHNVTKPHIQLESAERNLDWFRFWLLGQRDTDPAKAEEYSRWEAFAKHDPEPNKLSPVRP